jgi:hypothetical protein
MNQIRYAQRLCARTARLYRKLQTLSTVMTVVGVSATLTALASIVPHWVSVAGAAVLAVFVACMVAVRPIEKAVANENDARKYAALRTRSADLSDAELQRELEKARESDAAEIEPLRDIAWNDVATEIGRSDVLVPLKPAQRLLEILA